MFSNADPSAVEHLGADSSSAAGSVTKNNYYIPYIKYEISTFIIAIAKRPTYQDFSKYAMLNSLFDTYLRLSDFFARISLRRFVCY